MKIRRLVLSVWIGIVIIVVIFCQPKISVRKIDISSTNEVRTIQNNDAIPEIQITKNEMIDTTYPEDMRSELTLDTSQLTGAEKNHAIDDLMARRMAFLKHQCQVTGANKVKPATKWKKRIVLNAPHFFHVCATPKGGSTSWRMLTWRMPKDAVGRIPAFNILNVRNPLARLASAYRDKFLGGLPLYRYDEEWKAKIRKGSRKPRPWYEEWANYWFGALASRGSLPTKPDIRKRAVNAVNWANIDHGGNIFPVLLKYYRGSIGKLKEQSRNASFSFEDFLSYVIWTHDIGYMNKHWAPVVFECNPCKAHYDFIVHLETISPEFNYIMQFFNHTEEIRVEEKYKTKSGETSDIHLYKDIPKAVLKRILEIYKFDFELFGYRFPLL